MTKTIIMESTIYNQDGQSAGKIKLPEGVFNLPWNADLVHEIVRLMNSNSRVPIAHAKTRGEVRGGGKKPWKQKGTGRARHGSSRSPIWVGGGTTHGPRNDKNFDRKINKKAKTKALFTILSQKMKDGEILFVEKIQIKDPKTADAKKILSGFSKIKGFEMLGKKSSMFTFGNKDISVEKSFRNFNNISLEEFRNINPVSLLNHKYLVVTDPANTLQALTAKAKSE